jgi:hypothetical protein
MKYVFPVLIVGLMLLFSCKRQKENGNNISKYARTYYWTGYIDRYRSGGSTRNPKNDTLAIIYVNDTMIISTYQEQLDTLILFARNTSNNTITFSSNNSWSSLNTFLVINEKNNLLTLDRYMATYMYREHVNLYTL